jgi:hypothetical protein
MENPSTHGARLAQTLDARPQFVKVDQTTLLRNLRERLLQRIDQRLPLALAQTADRL